MSKTPLAALLVLLAFATGVHADVLTHKDGRTIEGTITSERDGKIKIKTEFGEFEFLRADITAIERGKTRWQEFEEREKTCKTGEDFFQLGEWAAAKKMTKETKRCMLKAIELDPQHAGARQFFGHVLYKGEWMTPEERDKRQKADETADMLARGFVLFQGRWVTVEEKGHLEKNEVLVDGVWIPFEDAQRKKGLELCDGQWLPRPEAIARNNAAVVEKLTGFPFQKLVTDDALLCGPQSIEELARIGESMKRGRAWFDLKFLSKPGLELFGNRLAEFYMFDGNDAYTGTCAHFGGLTTTVPEGWAEAVKKTHGFMWWDPYPLSSARRWNRPIEDLSGHDLHHFGHLLLNRLGYDGKLLPPWFDEGIAAVLEYESHGRNAVFCRGNKSPAPVGPSTGGTPPRKGDTKVKNAPTNTVFIGFDDRALRGGNWKQALAANIADVPAFDRLASLQFDELQGADIAASMGIVQWLDSRGEGSLRKFLDVLRKRAPPSPTRVIPTSLERELVYDEAFKAASGMKWREADRAWREWVARK
ncbi:MAG: hypothetical protein JNL28_12365 [Planctomycetes bacterium]|nr:hypothetical protein [Planctomycetota bacterium]